MTIRLTLIFMLVGTICFAQKNNAKRSEEIKTIELTSQQKDSILKIIYNRMYEASGTSKIKPEVNIKKNKAQIATYTPSKNTPTISLENEAFTICQSMGVRRDDAIAYLLSHEIGHHLTYDFWEGNYQDFDIRIKDSLVLKYGLDSLKNTAKYTIKTLQEIKADEKGGILRYMAGYSSENLTESLFEAIYSKYTNLKDTMKCYPPLQDRISISKIADSRARSFINIFEVANFSVLLKDYDFAISQYIALQSEFEFYSREIYNNIGVVYYLKALELSDEDDIKFIYPVEIDLESRIQSDRGSKGVNKLKVIEFLNKANENFKEATNRDPNYSTGFLNLACIQTILGEDYYLAISACNKAIKFSKNENEKQNAQLVLAIIGMSWDEGNKEKATKMMNNLIIQGNEFAIMNKSILEGKKWSELVFSKPLNHTEALNESYRFTNKITIEKINNIKGISDIIKANYNEVETFIYGNPAQTLETYYLNSAKVQLIHDKYFFITTKDNYADSTALKIKLGSTVEELKEKYGLPTVVLPAAQGYIYHYPKSKMMIVLNSSNIVTKWMVYEER